MTSILENGFTADSSADSFIRSDYIGTGAVHWVDSVNGSDSNAGTRAKPLATLGQAITNATANNGDIILVASGHTQTLGSSLTINKAGVKIFGIGAGTSAPQFTVAAAIDGINVTANDVEINNLYFPVGTTANNTSRINVDARNVRIKGCTFKCGAFDAETVTITANGIDCRIISASMEVTAAGPTKGISIESASATGLRIEDSTFNGGAFNWSSGAIHSAVAHLNFTYGTVTLTNAAQIVHTAAAKGFISNHIDGSNSGIQV